MFSIITKRDNREAEIIRLADKIIAMRHVSSMAEERGLTEVASLYNEIAGDLAAVAFNKANQLAYI